MTRELEKRMKENYEVRTRTFLPRRTYTIIRLDGKAFHTFTKGMKKPYDLNLISAMDKTAKFLCENVQGCKFGYVQSDEISLVLTDFDNLKTDAWFDGQVQKIVSVSASMATAVFNKFMPTHVSGDKLAFFDSRVFTIPERIEVENYFIWRQKDAIRNSVSALAQSIFSHKELSHKSSYELIQMCELKGQSWQTLPEGFKLGRMIVNENLDIMPEYNLKAFDTWHVLPATDFVNKRKEVFKIIPAYEI